MPHRPSNALTDGGHSHTRNDRPGTGTAGDRRHRSASRSDPGKGYQPEARTASDRSRNDRFGQSLAFGDGRLFIGAPGDDDTGSNSGSVYVYAGGAGNTWVFETKLNRAAAAYGEYFGEAVAWGGGEPFYDGPTALANSLWWFDSKAETLLTGGWPVPPPDW